MSYRYESLRDPTSIRLLRLSPGTAPQPLEFSLEEHLLRDCPSFEAISYVWGDATTRVPALCSGHGLEITKSLAAALSRLRCAESSRLLWADAICINQGDLIERGNQVKLMCQLYGQCSGVLVWLGLESETTRSALSLLDRIVDNAYHNYGQELPDLKSWLDYEEFVNFEADGRLPVAESLEWVTVKELFSRAWFERTWVVQEVAVASKVTVFCGDCTIPWQKLGIAALWIQRQVMKDDFKQWHIFEDSNLFEATAMFDNGWLEELDFLSSLNLFRGLLATDPRDKVFALLGLPPFASVSKQLVPDYTKTKTEVYRSIVELSLSSYGNLDILSYVHNDDPLPCDWPTWIPRWDVAPAAGAMFGATPENRYYGSGVETEEVKLHEYGYQIESDCLMLYGQFLGSITSISETITANHIRESERLTDHPIKNFLDTHLAGFQDYHKQDRTVLRLIYLCSTMTTGLNSGWQSVAVGPGGDRTVPDQHFADFAAYLLRFDPASPWLQRINEVFNSEDDYEGDASQYEVAASRVCDDRRLFLFKDSHVGIGPKAMRPGDQLYILFGGQMLYILRSNGDHHHFIGECYVHGLMYGSGLEKDEEGQQRVEEIRLR